MGGTVTTTRMDSQGSADAEHGEGELKRKRQRRFLRSKNGCLTCRQRKVKCDERQPTCSRCSVEMRVCAYPEVQTASPGRPLHSQQQHRPHHQQSPWSQAATGTLGVGSSDEKEIGRQSPLLTATLSLDQHPSLTQGRRAVASEPTQYDDWLAFLFGASSDCTPQSDFEHNINEWMSNNSVLFDETQAAATMTSLHHQQTLPVPGDTSHSPSAVQSSGQRRKMADSTLQQRLRELCTSDVQLEAVSQCEWGRGVGGLAGSAWYAKLAATVFNFVAQCFHLLSAEVNLWRRVYAEMSCQSPLTLNLVTCVGLISLSLTGPVNRRPLAYALFAKSISEWQSIVSLGQGTQVSQLRQHQVLEIIAGAILIGHVEQFDTGIAIHTTACMRETRMVIDAVVEKRNQHVDMTPGSHFRFLVRVFLWWDTLSRTMGPGSGGMYPRSAFEVVRGWEEEEGGEEVIEMSQCISGWPLDLLEAVARTQALAEQMQTMASVRSVSVHNETRSIESQIRTCRPKVVSQDTKDTILIAELRYVVYEALQAGAYVFFARKLLGDTKSTSKEVDKVIGFLNRRDVQGESGEKAGHHDAPTAPTAVTAEEEELEQQLHRPESRPYYLTRVMKKRGVWKERAPDGALLWSYLQSAMAIENGATQSACRQTLSRWETFKDFGAVSLESELLELIWEKRREDSRLGGEEIWRQVLGERRWRQLLIF